MFWQKKKTCICEVCRRKFPASEMISIKRTGPSLMPVLHEMVPSYDPKGMICRADLRKLRLKQIGMLFGQGDRGSANLEHILLHEEEISPYNFNKEYQDELTRGERFSQKITPFIGSWGFISLFLFFVIFWIGYNSQRELKEHFDPFPFILLNLFLSCMAAIQAPIIMMAHNRLSKRERLRADEDYYTTLKAEFEIRQLHEKIDEFLKRQKPH